MAVTAIIPEVVKEIKYNRQNQDYDCFVTIDGDEQYIGSASTYSEAEKACTTYAYDYYIDTNTPEKAAQIISSVFVSVGVGTTDLLAHPPRLATVGNRLTVRMGRLDDPAWEATFDEQRSNPRQAVQEVVHLRTRDAVVVVGETDIFIMTAHEFARQV